MHADSLKYSNFLHFVKLNIAKRFQDLIQQFERGNMIITGLEVETCFVEGAHEQLEPNDGVNDDNEQY